jgi:RHS repeat-associated protein
LCPAQDVRSNTFKYNPFGKRIEKVSPTFTSIFAYDGNNLAETVNSSGGEVARYAQALAVDQPLAMQRGTTTSYYEQDGLGSVTSLTNAAGAMAQSYTYDSFGSATNSNGSLTNFFRYTAREFDTETNLYYYRARYYDAVTGRFASEDPIRFEGGIDLYVYVGNDAANLTDAFGLCAPPKGPYSWTCIRDYTQPKFTGLCAYTCFPDTPGYIGIGAAVWGTVKLQRDCKLAKPPMTCPYSVTMTTPTPTFVDTGTITGCQQSKQ